ncbi:MAG: glycine betaine ABC transporter substrate-binding protein [Christensenellales bacterium]
MKIKKIGAILLVVVMLFAFTACGKKEETALRIYDGAFSEQKLLYRMVKLLVEEHTDLPVEFRDVMSGINIYRELTADNCDLMVSYDGTLLTTFLHLDSSDVPEGERLYDFVNRKMMEAEDCYLLDMIGLNNTYAIGVPQEIADRYNLDTISDLAQVADQLEFGAEHDFFTEEGSAKFGPFSTFYGLNFKGVRQIDVNLKYAAVESGNIDVMVVYTTDGLNKKAQLKVLEDDQNYFPDYNGALLVRQELFERVEDIAPNLKEVLNMLGDSCNNEEMTDLTYAVDVEGESPDDVARQFLQSKGLIS